MHRSARSHYRPFAQFAVLHIRLQDSSSESARPESWDPRCAGWFQTCCSCEESGLRSARRGMIQTSCMARPSSTHTKWVSPRTFWSEDSPPDSAGLPAPSFPPASHICLPIPVFASCALEAGGNSTASRTGARRRRGTRVRLRRHFEFQSCLSGRVWHEPAFIPQSGFEFSENSVGERSVNTNLIIGCWREDPDRSFRSGLS